MTDTTDTELQWGHNFFVMEISLRLFPARGFVFCFNGAITFSLWKLLVDLKWEMLKLVLQWGHNFFVMEIQQHLARELAGINASMGP